jgi:putative peptide zinc metalloprotease protein
MRARPILEIIAPERYGGRFVVHDPATARFFHLGHTAAGVLHVLDGSRSQDDIASALGVAAEQVAAVVARLAAHGLLEHSPEPRGDGFDNELVPASARRTHRTGLLSAQVDLLDPSRLLSRGGPVLSWLTGPAFWAAAGLAAVVGAAGAIAHGRLVLRVVGAPLPPAPAIAAMLALIPTLAAHEFAHAAIAWRHGAKARRMGVMLMYLVPSMFCDVSDCWRLPRRRDRVKVAAAGIGVQMVAGGAALGATLVPGLSGGLLTGLVLYGVANALLGAVNLLPLVRLDGYLMLMSALDIPHLRAKAIADARAVGARVVFGVASSPARLRHRRLAVLYGVACALCAPALGVYGLVRMYALLAAFGAPGAFMWLLGLSAVSLLAAE